MFLAGEVQIRCHCELTIVSLNAWLLFESRVMLPVLVEFGPLKIYSFGVFMALATLSALGVIYVELKRKGYRPDLASTMVFAAAAGGLAGARVLFIIEDWSNFLRAPSDFIFTGAGFTWYGGLIGGIIAVSWVVRKNNIPWSVGADMAAPALAIAYGIGRIGCHVAGDGDWGTITDVSWGVAYTNAIIGWVNPSTGIPYPPGVRVHPTPIYEFLQSMLIFVVLWLFRKRNMRAGSLFWLYFVLAGLARFGVEFWRINPKLGLGLSEAQWFGFVLVAVGLWQLAVSQPGSSRRLS